MISDLVAFIKKPVYEVETNAGISTKFAVLGFLLLLSLFISFGIALIISLIEQFTQLELGEHAIDLLFEEYGALFILAVVVLLAPVLEELLFRGPLYLFRNSRYFSLAYYGLTLIFGFYHITNFEITPAILLWSPVLVAPQLCIGLLLGYLRVRYGLLWAMALHALYNLVLVGPVILFKLLNIPLP